MYALPSVERPQRVEGIFKLSSGMGLEVPQCRAHVPPFVIPSHVRAVGHRRACGSLIASFAAGIGCGTLAVVAGLALAPRSGFFAPTCSSPHFHCGAPARCGAVADERRIVVGGEGGRVRMRKAYPRFSRAVHFERCRANMPPPACHPTSGGMSSTSVRVPGRVVPRVRCRTRERIMRSLPRRPHRHLPSRCARAAARSSMSGASLPATKAGGVHPLAGSSGRQRVKAPAARSGPRGWSANR
jgi:hypothetical protein